MPGTPSDLFIHQMEVGPMQNFVYFLGSKKTREAAVVDPAWEADTILRIAKEKDLRITSLLVSHYHYDHTNAIEEILETMPDVAVYVHKQDVPYLGLKGAQLKKTEGGEEILLGEVKIRFLHTPGHTPGSQCFHVADHLVSGDTLFIGACGRCDLPGGDAAKMYQSLTQKLMKLKDETLLYPGHNYADELVSTIGHEKKTNPYLLCETLDTFLKFRIGF